mmetsp:Transcript_39458/g.113406  ORF Transcript_39458/g.113406 Transcript_39458/m.113406 type:complete len:397 (+) Transcript_39458:41-1231(+)
MRTSGAHVSYDQLDPGAPTQENWALRHRRCLLVALAILLVPASAFVYDCHYLRQPWWSLASHGKGFSRKYFGGRPTLNYWNLPANRSQELLDDCLAELENVTSSGGALWGFASAAAAARLAYRCTSVPELVEQVPEQMRGVFWMKDNPFPEVLAVAHLAQWFDDERVLIAPFAPFMWAWPESKPSHAPMLGIEYKERLLKTVPYIMSLQYQNAFSFKFSECPNGWHPPLPTPFGLPGGHCRAGSGAAPEMTYATLQLHPRGHVEHQLKHELYSMEALPSAESTGNHWYRGIYGAPPVMGRCSCVSVGNYNLVKIIDGDGNPVEPYYSEYLRFLGDVRLVFWAGFSDETVQELLEADNFKLAWARMQELLCDEGLGFCGRRDGVVEEEAAVRDMPIF